MSIDLLTRFYDFGHIQVGPTYISLQPEGNVIGKISMIANKKNPFYKIKENVVLVRERTIDYPTEMEKLFVLLDLSNDNFDRFFYELYLAEWIKADNPKPKIDSLTISFEFDNNNRIMFL